MDKINTVMVNGQLYDAQTGLPVAKVKPAVTQDPLKRPKSATAIHTSLQKSQTLNRKATKKPITKHVTPPLKTTRKTMDIARSSRISRFAPRPTMAPIQPVVPDIPAKVHPLVAKAQMARPVKPVVSTQAPKTSQAVKQEAITAALARPATKTLKKSFIKKHPRLISVSSAVIALLAVGGYLTYINIPSLSVRVAATQAGINATYPQYHPDGYSVNQPITYKDGQVTIEFDANTGDSAFNITQTKSSWDSTAVRSMVDKASKSEFITSQEQGLTIYTYNGDAAWVNGGILYTIQHSGNIELSGDQIRQIATSM